VSAVRTLSQTKRNFYHYHPRPISAIYRQVVEELLVEMHLLSVNADFRYDPIYALGVVNSFERFMAGYQPEGDKSSIFNALCRASEQDPQQYRQDAERLLAVVDGLSSEAAVAWLAQRQVPAGAEDMDATLQAIAEAERFKYSRLFGIGLYELLDRADSELVQDQQRCKEVLQQCCQALNLPFDKLEKDLDLYRSNLEKLEQARSVMQDAVKADRKQRERRAQQNQSPDEPGDGEQADSSADEQQPTVTSQQDEGGSDA